MQLHDVICRREAGYAVVEGIGQEWVWHSPSGFEWGYGGSGPADLALNILLAATGTATSPRSIIRRSSGSS